MMVVDLSGWWLLKDGVAVAISKCKTTMMFAKSIESFTNDFSVA